MRPCDRVLTILATSVVASALLATASAEPPAPTSTESTAPDALKLPLADDRTWTVQFEPAVWYVAQAGRLTMPGGATSGDRIHLSELNLDSPRASPYGELHLRRDRWRLGVSGFWFSASDRAAEVSDPQRAGPVALVPGDRVSSSFDLWSVDAVAAYRFYDRAWTPLPSGHNALALGVDALVGARVYDLDTRVERLAGVGGPGASVSESGFYAEPIIGIKGDAEFFKEFTIDLQSTLGAQPLTDHNSWSWDLQVDGTWRPWPNFGIQVGYRQFVYKLNDGTGRDQFLFRGSSAGLFAGIEIRF